MIHASRLIDELKTHGVTHAIGLPDNASAALFASLSDDPDIDLVYVTREGEAFAIAAGLWVGGAVPVVLVQNTGFFESGDAIRGCATRMRVPLVCFLGYRGYKTVQLNAALPVPTPDVLENPDVDSCAVLFEPTLKAWGIPYDYLNTEADVGKIADVFAQARFLSCFSCWGVPP